MNALTAERLRRFKRNKVGLISTWIFGIVFFLTLFAEFLANDKPIILRYQGQLYIPIFKDYPETAFGGIFETAADYRDPVVAALIDSQGWMIWPPIRFSYSTINYNLPSPAPSPPTSENLLGTDDRGRDVLAQTIYGFRISVLFGLTLTVISSVIGVSWGRSWGIMGETRHIWSAFYRSVGKSADTLHSYHSLQCGTAQLLVAPGYTPSLQLDGLCRCGQGRISAGPKL